MEEIITTFQDLAVGRFAATDMDYPSYRGGCTVIISFW